MNIRALLISASVFCACNTALAADLDYSYLDLAYSKQSHDQLSGGSGYQADGSYALGSSFFLSVDYKHNSFTDDVAPAFSYSNHSYRLGGGYHQPLSALTDLVVRALYGRASSEADMGPVSPTVDHSGYDLGIGVRTVPAAAWELEAFLDHDDLGFDHSISPSCVTLGCIAAIKNDTSGSENVLSAGARYALTQNLAFGAQYSHSSLQSMNEWLLYARWSF